MIQPHPRHTRDLPLLLWLVFPLATIVLLILTAYTRPDLYELMLAKDADGGIVEYATVLILLPGIVAGFAVVLGHRKNLPSPWLGWWVLLWTMACVYFAGEEISWGQWFFHWETPELFRQFNKQEETNLHNISPWLYQKPQSLVEIWIFVAGVVFPVWWRYKNKKWVYYENTLKFWLLPTFVCIPAAAIATLVPYFMPFFNALSLSKLAYLGTSELHEYYIALFLCLYLLSIWRRIGACHEQRKQKDKRCVPGDII